MGLEFARGSNSRCPPFLVGGLMIMCLFLLCSWWSLSSQNFELLKQNDNLAEQLRINGEELQKCRKRKSEEEVQMKQMQEMGQELQRRYQKQGEELEEIRKKADMFLREKDMCHAEMESLQKVCESKDKTMETLRAQKNSVERALDEGKEKIAELEKKVGDLEAMTVQRVDEKQPIVKLLGKNKRKKENSGENVAKASQNESPLNIDQDNQDLLSMQGQNQDDKNEVTGAEADPREELMGMNANSV